MKPATEDAQTGAGQVAAVEPADERAWIGIEALDLLVQVLSQSDAGSPTDDDFYDRMCEAVCRLAGMRRAVIFRYDGALRRVRVAGAHGIDVSGFAGVHVTVDSAPFAAEALRSDQVVEVAGDLADQVPSEFAPAFAEPTRLVCAPMSAAGLAIGVILTDRPMSSPPVVAADRSLLWSLGKAVALASSARTFSRQLESARQLEQRIDLAREIHEGVIQRLFGVSMALDGDGELPAEARERCAAETQAAISELRAALQRPLGRAPRSTGTTLVAEVQRLARAHPELGLVLEAEAEVPPVLEPLAQSVLGEAVRNAAKHARPSRVAVRVGTADGAFVLEVVNDGVPTGSGRGRRGAGMGLRLAALEALQSGGVIEFGRRDRGSWQVRLVVPPGG